MHYLFFFNIGQVKLSMDKYLMVIYLSLGKYKLLLFPHPCFTHEYNCKMMCLTHINLASFLSDISKQCRPRSDATECGI